MPDARRIVLVRHGRTEWNASNRIQGQLDTDLDDSGHAEARAVTRVLAAMRPSLLWSSDLARARQTTEYVAAATGLAASYDDRLREFHLGERQGLTHAEYEALDAAEFAAFRTGDWAEVPAAEHPEAAAKRYVAALTDVAEALATGETGVIVSHGAVTRTGLVSFLGWPVETAHDLRALGNCCRVELVQRESGRWAMAAYNLPPETGTPIS